MHRALECYDILSEIFPYLQRSNKVLLRRFKNPDLVNCALVCKYFSEPALNVLWRELDNLLPLLKIIPSFHWDSATQRHQLHDEISSEDLELFKTYARRVRVLRNDHDGRKVHPESLLGIVWRNDRQCLLPCLRHLTWSQTSPYDPVLPFLVPPSLRTLTFNLTAMAGSSVVPASLTVAVEELLANVFSKATSLEELHLPGLNYPIASSPLVHIQRLHTVELKAEHSTAIARCLKTLSTAEKLVDLSISLVLLPTQPSINICAFDRGSSFPALHYLHAKGSFLNMSQLVKATSSPSVEYLHMDAWDKHCLRDLRAFLATLQSKVGMWSTTLHTVHLSLRVHPDDGDIPHTMNLFGPILAVRNLTVIRIETPLTPMNLSDEDVDILAHAWPGIMELELIGDFASPASLRAIVDLVGHCPKLHKLSLPMIIDGGTLQALEHRTDVVSTCFQDLDFKNVVFDVDVQQATHLGVLLDRFFPRIDYYVCLGRRRKYSPHEWSHLRTIQLSISEARFKRRSRSQEARAAS